MCVSDLKIMADKIKNDCKVKNPEGDASNAQKDLPSDKELSAPLDDLDDAFVKHFNKAFTETWAKMRGKKKHANI